MGSEAVRDIPEALQLYERPTLHQKQAVSRVLVQGTQNFTNKEDTDKEISTKKSTENPTTATGFTFSTLSNCNINIHIGSGGEKTAQQLLERVNTEKN